MLPTTIEVQTKVKTTGEVLKGSFVYSMPETMAECLEVFREEGVKDLFLQQLKITIQDVARKKLPSNDLQSEMDNWKYGEKAPRIRASKDPVNDLLSRWDSYSPEYQAEILAAFAKKAGTGVVPGANHPDGAPIETPVPSARPRSRA